jgi:hypothetical protein
MTCEHQAFQCNAAVGRLSELPGGPITSYTVEITVHCTECGLPFRFIGLPAGNHYAEPRVSMDGTQLRAPLEPAEHQKFQLQASYAFPSKVKQ